MNKNENVFSRWSRRKLQSEQQSLQEDIHLELEQLQPGEQTRDPAAIEVIDGDTADIEAQPVLTDADMPDLETLNPDSDFAGFMSPGVSDELRNLALRKLFKAPAFNICDGLDEYDEDYTSFEKLGDIITCDMQHQIEMEAQKKLQQQQEDLVSVQVNNDHAGAEEKDEETIASGETASGEETQPHHSADTDPTKESMPDPIFEVEPETKTRDPA